MHVDDLRLEQLAAAEGEQLAGDRRRSLAGELDLLCVRPPRVARGQRGEQQLAVAVDRGEQVVEVMGDATGQATDGLHLVRLAELLLEPPPGRDVEGHDDPRRPAAHGEAVAGHLHLDDRAILADMAKDRATRDPGPEAGHRGHEPVPVRGVHQAVNREPGDLLSAVAVLNDGRVIRVQDPEAGRVPHGHRDGMAGEQLAIPCFRQADGVGGPACRAHVPRRDVGDGGLRIDGGHPVQPPRLAAPVAKVELGHGGPVRVGRLQRGPQTIPVVRLDQIGDGRSLELVWREAENGLPGRVGPADDAVRADLRQQVVRQAEERVARLWPVHEIRRWLVPGRRRRALRSPGASAPRRAGGARRNRASVARRLRRPPRRNRRASG